MRILKALGWIALFVGGAIAIAGLVIVGLMAWMENGMCREWVSDRVVSPDGQRTAVVRHADCGAATSVGSEVEIEPGGERVFTSDGATLDGLKYGVGLRWLDPTILVVSYHQAHWSRVEKGTRIRVIEHRDLPPDRP